MGAISLAELLPSPPEVIDHAKEIGGYAAPRPLTATRISLDGSRLIYLEEVPISHAAKRRVEEYGQGQRARWTRLEFKTDSRNSPIKPGEYLVVAEHPYANGWVQTVPFKRPSKKGPDERPDQTVATYPSQSEFIAWVEAQTHDYWETGNYLTAGISEPDIALLGGKQPRNNFLSLIYAYGLCANPKEHAELLYASPEAQQLLQMTWDNTIRFWFPRAKLGSRPKLKEETISAAEELLWLSIHQALAGPHEESENWAGRPVMDKVDDIYRGHLSNMNRAKQ